MFLSRSQPVHRFRAFSVAELLVVIAVIGVLIAILMPVVGRLREEAMTLRCLANLRQIGVALNLYANDKQQYYPPTFSSVRNPPNSKTWMTTLAPYAGYPSNAMGSAPRARAVGVFYCPKMTEEEKTDRRVGYFYNSAVVGVTIRRQTLSPRAFLVVEGRPANAEGLLQSAFLANPPDRHQGAANFLYVDGSAETLLPPFNKEDPRWNPNGTN